MTEVVKESGIAWIGRVPASWDVVMLKRTTYLKGRIGWQGLTTDEYLADGDCLLVTGTDFEGGRIQWPRCPYVNRERYDEDPYIQLKEGDLLVTKDGTIGKVATVRRLPKPATLNSGVFVTRPLHGRYRQEFLYWVLISDVFPEFIRYSMVGTTINHLYQKTFERFVYALPPLPEQELIAAYLDASCAAIDAAVAAKRGQLEILDGLSTTLVYEAVTQGINRSAATVVYNILSYGQTPKHWKRSRLRYEISIQNGDFASDKLQDDGARPILGGNGVMGHTDLSNVDGETVVIGRVGAYCGNAHYVQGKAWVSDNALIVKSRHHARFLCHLFNALDFNTQANNTAQPVITGTKIKNTYVVLPPLAEQQDICAYLDMKLAEVKRIASGIETQIATLTAYRKSLIHECVTGQRRISEADSAGSPQADVTAAQRVEPSLSKLR